MTLKRITLILIFLSTYSIITACIFKRKKIPSIDKQFYGIWSTQNITLQEADCECGTLFDDNIGSSTSILYIFINSSDETSKSPNTQNCIGTIIASNLIATSHACIQRELLSLNVYDGWSVNSAIEATYNLTKLIVSTQPFGEDETFNVEQVILSEHYLKQQQINETLRNEIANGDILLIKVGADFTNHPTHKPVCLPPENTSFMGKIGYYVGGGSGIHPSKYADIHQGIISAKKDKLKNGLEYLEPFIIEWEKPISLIKMFLGGPLLIPMNTRGTLQSDLLSFLGLKKDDIDFLFQQKPQRLFLAGILHDIAHLDNDPNIYAYFSNIISHIKYIHYMGKLHKSIWCKKPNLTLEQKPSYSSKGVQPFEFEEVKNCESKIGVYPPSNSSNLDVVLYEISLKTEELNTNVLLERKYKKLLPQTKYFNRGKFLKTQSIPFPTQFPTNLEIDIIKSINKRRNYISFKLEQKIDMEFRNDFRNLHVESALINAYENQIHLDDALTIIQKGTEHPTTSINVTIPPCSSTQVAVTCRYVKNIKLKYEAFAEVTGPLRDRTFLSSADVKASLPKDLEFIEKKSCYEVIAKGEGEVSLSFSFGIIIDDRVELNTEC